MLKYPFYEQSITSNDKGKNWTPKALNLKLRALGKMTQGRE